MGVSLFLSVCSGKPLVMETLVAPLTDVGRASATIITDANNVVVCVSAAIVSLALIVYLSLSAFAGSEVCLAAYRIL